MENFVKGSDYKLMVAHATAHGINHNGVNKQDLVEALNAKLAELGEEAYLAAIVTTEEVAKTAAEADQNLAPTVAPVAGTTKAPKWFEAQGFAYKEGDVVLVKDHKIKGLNGRFAMVNKPSAKKEAVKAFLYEPKTGALQATNITLDYDNCEPAGLGQDEVVAKILEEQNAKAQVKETAKAQREADRAAKKAQKEVEKQARIAKANEAKAAPAATTQTA